MPNLESINFSHNNLVSFDSSVMKNLEILNINNNLIELLPPIANNFP